MTDPTPSHVPAAALAEFIARAFVAVGLPHGDAARVAGLMAEADCRDPTGTARSAWRPTSSASGPAAST